MKTPRQDPPKASDRNERLKAALKVNIARRKEQAKARAHDAETGKGAPAGDAPDTQD